MDARIANSCTMSRGLLSRKKIAGRPGVNMNLYDFSYTLHNGEMAGV